MRKNKYSKEQIKFVRENAFGKSNKELIYLFNEKFGIEMTLSKMKALKGNYGITSGLTGYFPKGNVPFNKGKTWDEFMSPEAQRRSMETTFQKGGFTHNRREIGEERFNSDGYWYVKVQDGKLNENWKLKHHIIWEEANGPIPDDKIIIFLDGNTSNMELENMRMITRQVSVRMAQQRLYSDNRELTLAGSLTVEINEKVKKHN
ncbi:MAG: HNH endonuclease signature motif containing protein [Erysipelothrix sp.]